MGWASQADAVLPARAGCLAATLAMAVRPVAEGGLGQAAPAEGDPTPNWLEEYTRILGQLETMGLAVPEGMEVGEVLKTPYLKAQTALSKAMATNSQATLTSAVGALPNNLEGKVRREALLAHEAKESGAWMTASPWTPGTKMSDWVFVAAARTWLCIPVDEVPVGTKCLVKGCGRTMDTLGQHAFTCPGLREFRSTQAAQHQRQLRATTRGAREGIITLPCEPVMQTWMQPKAGRVVTVEKRADVGIIPKNGQNAGTVVLIDLTLVATSTAAKESGGTGAAAQRAEKRKDRLYEQDYERKPAPAPLAFVKGFGQETGGPLGDFAKKFLRYCAEQTPPQGPPGHDPVGRRYGRILEHFSVFLQKHCAIVQRQYTYQCCKPAPPDADPNDAAAPEEGEVEPEE
jgi:hypothetical protein